MNALFSRQVAAPLAAIFIMQTALTLAAYAFPVVIPVAAVDIGLDPDSVGLLTAAIYLTGMLAGLATGGLLARFGPTGVFQGLLAVAAIGAMATTLGTVWAAFLAAVLVGCATGPMNPVGSNVLARAASADDRALVFSLKQCATPAGGMAAGALLPALAIAYDWQTAMIAVAVASALLILLAPLGGLGARPPRQAGAFDGRGPFASLMSALRDPNLRAVTLAGFGLAICQMGLASYLVVFLWQEAGFTVRQAGEIFAVLHASGIGARIVLGFVADRLIAARWVLALLGAALCVALSLLLNVSGDWPHIAVYGVVMLAGASGNGWVGLYYAELARLAPDDRVAEVSAGSQFVTYLGLVTGPLAFAAGLSAFGSYAVCFGALAVVALIAAVFLASAGGGARADNGERAGGGPASAGAPE